MNRPVGQSGLQFLHCRGRQNPALCALRIDRYLPFALMAGYRHDLSIGTAEFGEPRAHYLAQAVRRALRQFGLIAPITKLPAESGWRKWPGPCRLDKCEAPGLAAC